jgi:hypothetical protein
MWRFGQGQKLSGSRTAARDTLAPLFREKDQTPAGVNGPAGAGLAQTTKGDRLRHLSKCKFQTVWSSPRTPASAMGNVRMLSANCCDNAVTKPSFTLNHSFTERRRSAVEYCAGCRENGVSEDQRIAALVCEDRVQLHSANGVIEALGNAGSKRFSPTSALQRY